MSKLFHVTNQDVIFIEALVKKFFLIQYPLTLFDDFKNGTFVHKLRSRIWSHKLPLRKLPLYIFRQKNLFQDKIMYFWRKSFNKFSRPQKKYRFWLLNLSNNSGFQERKLQSPYNSKPSFQGRKFLPRTMQIYGNLLHHENHENLRCQNILSYAISTVAISTAHNFSLSNFRN